MGPCDGVEVLLKRSGATDGENIMTLLAESPTFSKEMPNIGSILDIPVLLMLSVIGSASQRGNRRFSTYRLFTNPCLTGKNWDRIYRPILHLLSRNFVIKLANVCALRTFDVGNLNGRFGRNINIGRRVRGRQGKLGKPC